MTGGGLAMIVVGCAVGAGFAVAAFAIGVASLPLLLDRKVRIGQAIGTSVLAVRNNPGVMAAWSALVVAGLWLSARPFLVD